MPRGGRVWRDSSCWTAGWGARPRELEVGVGNTPEHPNLKARASGFPSRCPWHPVLSPAVLSLSHQGFQQRVVEGSSLALANPERNPREGLESDRGPCRIQQVRSGVTAGRPLAQVDLSTSDFRLGVRCAGCLSHFLHGWTYSPTCLTAGRCLLPGSSRGHCTPDGTPGAHLPPSCYSEGGLQEELRYLNTGEISR